VSLKKTNLNKKYDFIILGSGLGGLQSAYVLSKKGFKVCVLEKNPKIGGTLQSFRRFGCDFSTGMHYLGSLDEDQMLNRIFKYYNLFDNIKYKRMDADAFEIINIAGKEYKYPIGWDRFRVQFLEYFPGKEKIFNEYLSLISRAVNSQALYSLKNPNETGNGEVNLLMKSAFEVLKSLSSDLEIQNYLAALSFDYGGEKEKTPFYVHALVTNYFVKSSYRIVGDSDQVADSLSDSIISFGGEIIKRQKVNKLIFKDEKLIGAETHTGNTYFADKFISNIHPANTMDLVEEGKIKKIYRNRMKNMENTISSFSIHIKLKENSFKYLNGNHQYFKQNDVWYASYYDEKKWPEHFFLHTPPLTQNDKFANSLQILTYMKYEEVKKWENTTRTKRPEEYQKWKQEKAQKLINFTCEQFPDLKENIEDYNISTPLSFKDYIGTSDGSMYGRISDFNNAVSNYVSHKTKIPNLFLTGQNLNLHGMLGVSLSSLITVGEFVGLKNLLEEIKNA
jgi:all-trans-retinol 13,14-reductase